MSYGHEFTDEEVRAVLDMVMNTRCGYCMDGEDCGADRCPECGVKQLVFPASKLAAEGEAGG